MNKYFKFIRKKFCLNYLSFCIHVFSKPIFAVFNLFFLPKLFFLFMQKLLSQPHRQLLRCPSHQDTLKYGTNTTIHTSCSSIESVDDEYRKSAIKWLIEFDRKVTKDTNYLSVWYLEVAMRNGIAVKQSNWQLVAGAIMMFSSKMNQIYPPSVSSVLKRCKSVTPAVTKQGLIEMEGKILNTLGFNVAIQSPYNLLCQILGESKKDIEECEKLLKIIIYNKEINQHESDTLANAIIYLIARNKIDLELQGEVRTRVKTLAQKIYNYYKDVRKSHDALKTKEKNVSTPEQKTMQQRQLEHCSSKQNITTPSVGLYSSLNSYQPGSLKKTQDSYAQQLTRANSYKFIPKPFTQATNVLTKDRKLYHCVSRDDLKNSYKNMYFYS